MPKKWMRTLFRRRMLVIYLILLQAVFFIYLVVGAGRLSRNINSFFRLVSLFVFLHIISRKGKGAYKLAWSVLVLAFPVFGGLFYLLMNFQMSTRKFRKNAAVTERAAQELRSLGTTLDPLPEDQFPAYRPNIRYLRDHMCFPVYDSTTSDYLSSGEKMLERLLEDLASAEEYIFLEFFIVQEGVMWNAILDILQQKAATGVRVRLLYDDIGCFLTLPSGYPKKLREMGIECSVFNPFRPFLTAQQNNRDHRKIAVIDGRIAYTGGVNLADEYINLADRFGHWKDAAIRLEGRAAWAFTLFFLQMWTLTTGLQEDFHQFTPDFDTQRLPQTDGLIQPYADSPTDADHVGEHVYLQIIQQAKNYCYIATPYLIIDDSMLSALCLAAQSGVDVRIITPHRWDKRLVHLATRSFYRDLVQAGVKVYEYSRGFLHAKTFVSDDAIATVGTTNLDYRSLYLHFECGTVLYGSSAVEDIKKDFLQTMGQSQLIGYRDYHTSLPVRLLQSFLRVIAPLM